MGTDTYLILEKPDRCQLAKIRSLIVSKLMEMSAHGDNVNIDLELRVSEEFLHFQMERIIQSTIHEVQKHLCTLGTNSLHQLEPSPIHPNALIRDRGDIIQEMQCKTVEVTSSPGYQRHDNVLKNICPYI